MVVVILQAPVLWSISRKTSFCWTLQTLCTLELVSSVISLHLVALSLFLPTFCTSVCWFLHLFFFLSVNLSLPVCPSVCLSCWLSVWLGWLPACLLESFCVENLPLFFCCFLFRLRTGSAWTSPRSLMPWPSWSLTWRRLALMISRTLSMVRHVWMVVCIKNSLPMRVILWSPCIKDTLWGRRKRVFFFYSRCLTWWKLHPTLLAQGSLYLKYQSVVLQYLKCVSRYGPCRVFSSLSLPFYVCVSHVCFVLSLP